MPLLRGCCSLDLKIGTKIIGIICLIFAILGFLSTAVICIALNIMEPLIKEELRKSYPSDDGSVRRPPHLQSQFLDSKIFQDDDDDTEYKEAIYKKTSELVHTLADNLDIMVIVFLIILAQQFIEIVVSSLLIHGIRRVRRGLLLPWIVMHALYVILELGLIVLFITIIAYLSNLYTLVLPLIAVDLCWMALHIYFILVVVSQYQALGLIRMHEEMSMK